MAIKRPELSIDRDFTIIRNAWARDGRLSLRARGLLLQLYSHRAGWEVTIESLMRVNPEGRNAIRAAIGELEQHGYLKRQQQVSGGRYGGMDYIVCDPLISGVGKTDIGKTDVGEPAHKEDYSSEHHREEALPALAVSDGFDEFWSVYPRKKEKKRAQTAWKSAVKREPAEGIIAAAKNYAQERNHVKDGEQFTKHASTWLNNDCWEDYRTSPVKASPVFWADAL